MKEIWENIKDYEGLYQISNSGRVKSMKKTVSNKGSYGGTCTYHSKILKTYIDTTGYEIVVLSNSNKKTTKRIHRLLAETFIPKVDGKCFVNHIDGNKLNNSIENLEWCTHQENIQHAWDNKLISIGNRNKKGINNKKSIKVDQYTKDNLFIKRWDCIRDVERELKIANQNISKCCKGIYKTCGGYIWKYSNQ